MVKSVMRAGVAVLLVSAGFAAAVVWGKMSDTSPRQPAGLPSSETDIGTLPDFSNQPPSESLRGNILHVSGTVLLYPRSGAEPSIATPGAQLVQDDALSASPSATATVGFETLFRLSFAPESFVTFSRLLPQSFIVWQRKGSVTYVAGDPGRVLNVRVLNSLFALTNGSARVAIEPDSLRAQVTVSSGSATLGQVDAANETRVEHLTKGESAVIDAQNSRIIRLKGR